MMADLRGSKQPTIEPVPTIEETGEIKSEAKQEHSEETSGLESCDKCSKLLKQLKLDELEKEKLSETVNNLESRYELLKVELEKEIIRRCDLEEKFNDEARRTSDKIEELIRKSDLDDAKLEDLRKKFDTYSRETSSMIETFSANREVLTSQLFELRQENDYLLGKFIGKSRDLQNGEINLPQTIDELQFHCLTLNEKLILATLAKEQLEETLIMMQASQNSQPIPPLAPQTATSNPNPATVTNILSPEHHQTFHNRHKS